VPQLAADYAASCAIYHVQVSHTGGHPERVSLLKRNLPRLLVKSSDSFLNITLIYNELSDMCSLPINLADV